MVGAVLRDQLLPSGGTAGGPAERLEAQATAAQLAMLRYQLNPHFLFNTLNSISTLVLLKQTEPANAMLTRLSSFLRHTLLTQPTGKVTVEQEIETLKLYLGIERMRFEERLRTDFQIEPAASGSDAACHAAAAAGRKRNQIRGVAARGRGAESALPRGSSDHSCGSPFPTPVRA